MWSVGHTGWGSSGGEVTLAGGHVSWLGGRRPPARVTSEPDDLTWHEQSITSPVRVTSPPDSPHTAWIVGHVSNWPHKGLKKPYRHTSTEALLMILPSLVTKRPETEQQARRTNHHRQDYILLHVFFRYFRTNDHNSGKFGSWNPNNPRTSCWESWLYSFWDIVIVLSCHFVLLVLLFIACVFTLLLF